MLHAHPGGEALFTGGSIAKLVECGHRVVLVYATRGELGEQRPGILVPGQSLGLRRTAEARWSANVLGAQRVEFLGYGDSGPPRATPNDATDAFANADIDEIAPGIASILIAENADALVAYDPGGVWGHPDFVQVHRLGTRVAQLVPTVSLYEATLNRDYLTDLVSRLQRHGAITRNPFRCLPEEYGSPAAVITHAIGVGPYISLKRRAITAHASQPNTTTLSTTLTDAAFLATFGVEWFIKVSRGEQHRGPTPMEDIRTGTPNSSAERFPPRYPPWCPPGLNARTPQSLLTAPKHLNPTATRLAIRPTPNS